MTSAEASEQFDAAIVILKSKFHNSGQLASLTQTKYGYYPNYKARGIASVPTETRVLNPANPNDPDDFLAKTETIYDNTFPASNPNYPYSTETYGISGTFQCPSGFGTPNRP
ncbi:MAG: hypothetical protein IPJ30_09785 [Acidobacteria bacterium]|nr:hypothetical protein [Acidobacteriota bacterium]